MNFYALFGLVGALASVAFGTVLLAPLIYVDMVSAMMVGLITFYMMLATFGAQELKRIGWGAVRRWLNPAGAEEWSPGLHMKAVRFADVGGHLCIVGGTGGTLIGCVQMLRQLEDPSAIGPAIAVAMLSLVYPVALYAFFFVPLARYHKSQARSEGVLRGDISINSSVVMLMLALLAVGGSFSILLVSMGEY